MSVRRISIVLSAAALLLASCTKKPSPVSTGPVDAGVATAPQPAQLQIGFAGTTVDGARVELQLSEADRPVVPQLQTLELRGNLALQNDRVRVFDEADRVVESDDTTEDLDGGFRYAIRFREPLKTGLRYALVVDAENGTTMRDSAGQEHSEIRREFQIEGEKQKPEPPAPQKPKVPSRRRRH